jgi:peptidoglycan/xylan/chitin deacetylase (PgdA/CDA1 family)
MLSPEKLIATAVAAAGAAVLVNGVMRPESQLFGATLVAARNPAEAALTYALLEVLARHNARATFFMIGDHVRRRPGIARTVHAAGHLIGNHTMTHPWLAWKPAKFIRQQLADCSHALEDALGAPVHYFRPPHGARRPFVMRAATELGMKTVQWNVMGYDWQPIGADRILANLDSGLLRAHKKGLAANILLHDGSDVEMGADRSATIAATERLLQHFAAEAIRTVTVDAWA